MNNPEEGKPRRRYYYRDRKKKFRPHQQYQKNNQKKFSFRKISIVVPLLNEEDSIKPLYQEIRNVTRTITPDYELIFVDDGSTDKSLERIKEVERNDKKVKHISFRKNFGKSAALQAGFKYATGDAVITMDADLQDDPAEIPNLLQKLDEGFDLVSGWKKVRHDPFIKKYSSRFFNRTTRLFSKIKIHDFNCGLKAYKKDVIKNLKIYGELHRYIPVLAGWQGFKITEVVVKHHARKYGKTKFGISRFFKGPLDLMTVIFTTRYIKRPMHLFGTLGFVFFLVGILINIYLTYEKLFVGRGLSNRPILFLGILLVIVGAQFFAVGLLGEIIVHNNRDDDEHHIKEKN